MAITMRDAGPPDYPAVRACMDEVFRETAGQKTSEFGQSLWEWQYLRAGRPSLIGVADDGGRVCGYYHALLFAMRRDGREALGAMVQDVGTLASYRGQGVFRDMGGYALRRLEELGVEFIYTFPNERSRPSFERNHKYQRVARVPVWVTPLAAAALVAGRLGVPGLAALGAPFGPLHRAWRRAGAKLPPEASFVREAAFGPEIAALAQAFSARVFLSLDRTAGYLDWRFARKPNGGYECWSLRRDGKAVAHVVTRRATLFDSPCVAFMDFGCAPDADDDLRRLIAVRLAAEQREGAMLGVTMGLHPFFSMLGGLGFLRVPERLNPRPFNLLTRVPGGTEGKDLLDRGRWHITLADWDVL